MKITKNAAQCLLCEDVIESKHRHDFVSCKCGNLFVDGGKDYLRRGFTSESTINEAGEKVRAYKDLSETEPVL